MEASPDSAALKRSSSLISASGFVSGGSISMSMAVEF